MSEDDSHRHPVFVRSQCDGFAQIAVKLKMARDAGDFIRDVIDYECERSIAAPFTQFTIDTFTAESPGQTRDDTALVIVAPCATR